MSKAARNGEWADMKPVVIVKCAPEPFIVDIDIYAEGDDMDMRIELITASK